MYGKYLKTGKKAFDCQLCEYLLPEANHHACNSEIMDSRHLAITIVCTGSFSELYSLFLMYVFNLPNLDSFVSISYTFAVQSHSERVRGVDRNANPG